MNRWMSCGAVIAALVVSAAAQAQTATPPAQPAPPAVTSRGQMLYANHCIACHTTQMHWRDKKLVTDWVGLKGQVRRWQGTAQLNWSEEDIDDVARFLNDTYYRLPAGKVAVLAPGAMRP
jgi:mono/diheme cytochrome c family protein